MAELSGLALCTEFTFIQQEGCMVTLKEDYSESVIFTMTFFTKIFQHPIQIRHQILLRLHSSSHTREKVSINRTIKKSLSRQRRRASTHQKAAIRDKYREGGEGGGRGTKTRSGLFRRRAATGGEEKPEWHADAVPGPLDLEG